MELNHKLRIGLLLCDDVDPDARDEYGTYTGMFRQGLDSAESSMVLTPFRAFEGAPLPSPEISTAMLSVVHATASTRTSSGFAT